MTEETEKNIEMFMNLWNNGYRFIADDDKRTGIEQETSPGVYELTTLKGLKSLAKQGKLVYDGMPLTENDAEMFLNIVGFCTTLKNNR